MVKHSCPHILPFPTTDTILQFLHRYEWNLCSICNSTCFSLLSWRCFSDTDPRRLVFQCCWWWCFTRPFKNNLDKVLSSHSAALFRTYLQNHQDMSKTCQDLSCHPWQLCDFLGKLWGPICWKQKVQSACLVNQARTRCTGGIKQNKLLILFAHINSDTYSENDRKGPMYNVPSSYPSDDRLGRKFQFHNTSPALWVSISKLD